MNSQNISLYRREALQSRLDGWLGRPRLIQPISVRIATALALVVFVTLFLLLFWGQYTRRVTVSGTVVPSAGVSRIFAPASGRIISSNVTEGQAVSQGATLYVLEFDSQTNAGETGLLVRQQLLTQADHLASSLQAFEQSDRLQRQEVHNELGLTDEELSLISQQIESAAVYLGRLQKSMESYRKLSERGLVTSREFDVREQKYMDVKHDLQTLRRQETQLKITRNLLQAKFDSFAANSIITRNDYRLRIAGIEQALIEGEAHRSVKVVAPRGGIATGVVASAGQMVSAGAALMNVVPNDVAMEIQLLADSGSVGFVQAGQKVLLKFKAYPYQKFGQYTGKISSISAVTLEQEDIPFGRAVPIAGADTRKYRIMVKPEQDFVRVYGNRMPLKMGMAVEANILLDTRRLYQWMFEPLYSLQGSVL